MPRLNDLQRVRALLDRDRVWAAYAIGDLAPQFVAACEWLVPQANSAALVLVYRGFTPPIVFAMGPARELCPLFAEIDAPEISLHVRRDAVEALGAVYAVTSTRRMLRMAISRGEFQPLSELKVAAPDFNVAGPSLITEAQLGAVQTLYADGQERGEAPTFFSPSMLAQGTFHGIWEGDALIAIAGTHLYSRELGVCAVGNVYTRRDRRGRGLGAHVTGAVVAHALREQIATIVLNVGVQNIPAQRVYERLGFKAYGEFLEGEAVRVVAPAQR